MAVDETVDLDSRLAHGAIAGGVDLVIGNVLFVVNALNGEPFTFLRASEDGANANGDTAVITDRFDCGFRGIACGDGCRENENVLADDHGSDIIAEDDLASAGVFGGDDVNGAVRVHVHVACARQLACHASAHDFRAVETKDRVDDLRGGNLIAKELCARASLGKAVLGHGEVNIIIRMAVAGGKMPHSYAQGEISVLAGDFDEIDCHNVLLQRTMNAPLF